MIARLLSLLPYFAGILFIHLYFRKKQKAFAEDIAWASLRTTIQLLLLAFALEEVFKSKLIIVSLLITLFMTINSSAQIRSRSRVKILHLFWISLVSNILAIWPLAFLFSMDISDGKWAEPQKLLPLMGMLLGNTLSGVSIGLESFMLSFRERQNEIVTLMALGASNEESTQKYFNRALRAGISPQINSMLSMGIISIPGMMAGQLISNSDPMDASIIQIKMMLAICIGTILSITIALRFVRRGLFLPSGELCLK